MRLAIVLAAVLLIGDRVLKILSRREKLQFEGKAVRLTHLENPGFFMGLGSRYRRVLRWAPFLLWIAAAVCLLPHIGRRTFPAQLGILLVLCGGLSNQYDRMRRGSVTDYIQLPHVGKKLRHLVWNLADVMLLGGVVLTVVGLLRELIREA